ncbi:uncharacterized protein [Rutidosis leptorrhynchoides]|uniref:uncharacterized protein n=1 Tax=Rutidosis leptorrhynchoides TaxID=125765 RepID=UPI003A99015B
MGKHWEWANTVRGHANGDLQELNDLLAGCSLLTSEDDNWKWSLHSNGVFKVKTLFDALDKHLLGVSPNLNSFYWLSSISKKINVFDWRLSLDKIATRVNLLKLGVSLDNNKCPFCDRIQEDRDHLFVTCSYIVPLWRSYLAWWGLSCPLPNGLNNILNGANFNTGSANSNKAAFASRYVLLWLIWKWRNKLVHCQPERRQSILKEDVMISLGIMIHLWFKSRSKWFDGDFETWKTCPRALIL